MQVRVTRWGNSLGLRIPKDVALRTGLREGARVDIAAEGDRIVISPARPRYVLGDLLRGEAGRDASGFRSRTGQERFGNSCVALAGCSTWKASQGRSTCGQIVAKGPPRLPK